MSRIAIIGNLAAGKGLAADARLLERLFTGWGYNVVQVGYRDRDMVRVDLALHLEVHAPRLFRYARRNVLIPNIEFFRLRLHGKAAYDRIWTKTRHAQDILRQHNIHSDYLGFSTEDLYRADVERIDRFLHVAGGSAYRNTRAVIGAWRDNWREGDPHLTVVARQMYPDAPGVLQVGRIDRPELIRLMNACRYHLLPSGMEGFGVALWEGASVGASIITTDAPPMNEAPAACLIAPSGDIEIAPDRLVRSHVVSQEAVWGTLRHLTLREGSPDSRSVWQEHHQAFRERLKKYVQDVVSPQKTITLPQGRTNGHAKLNGNTPTVDFLATEHHFADHLLPVYHALPEAVQGTFYGTSTVVGYLRSRGARVVDGGIKGRFNLPQSGGPVVTSASGDQVIVAQTGRASIFSEHGSGQTYRRLHDSYAGWRGRKGVILFLCPGPRSAERNRVAYPRVPIVMQGPVRLDPWLRGEKVPLQNAEPVIAVSFHWNCKVVPETESGFQHFAPGVLELSKRYKVLGHGHPRAWRQLRPFYERHGIELAEDFEEVLRRADVYCVDNSSTLFEFAASSPPTRPVVVLNPPQYRRDVRHGLRFWECASIGVNCDHGRDLTRAVEEALIDSPEQQQFRAEALEKVYPARVLDGRAAERAASAILAVLRGDWPAGSLPPERGRTGRKSYPTTSAQPTTTLVNAMPEEKNVRMLALNTFRNKQHEGDVIAGRYFYTTETRAKILESPKHHNAVRAPEPEEEKEELGPAPPGPSTRKPAGPSVRKPAGPSLTKRHKGGGYYEILDGDDILDTVKGKAAADERIEELTP